MISAALYICDFAIHGYYNSTTHIIKLAHTVLNITCIILDPCTLTHKMLACGLYLYIHGILRVQQRVNARATSQPQELGVDPLVQHDGADLHAACGGFDDLPKALAGVLLVEVDSHVMGPNLCIGHQYLL